MDPITIDQLLRPGGERTVIGVLTAMLTSFVLSSLIAWVYSVTYRGFSYSRAFVHALILGSVVATVMIAGIGNSLALGLGVIGALAIIRFRTQIRDPRDIIFLFAALAVGIASGAGGYVVAVVGTVVFILVAGYLHWAPIANLHTHEGLVRFMTTDRDFKENEVARLLEECCSHAQVSSMREAIQGDGMEYTYEVRLRDPSYQTAIVNRLNAVRGVQDASILMHRATVEI